MARIAHVSDVHFGRITHPDIVEALIDEVNGQDVDLVAVSGDLTQRARHHEFEAAARMLDAFHPPTLVVPGNHDVYPWWHPVARLTHPLRRYRRYIDDDLWPSFERTGVSVLGLNSAYGRTVKGGRIGSSAREHLRAYFEAQPEKAFKILVVHHHLTRIQALGPHDVARQARKTLDIASDVGIDLILCGHLHISHIEPVVIVPADGRIVIASAGTATSNRGRRSNRDTNFYNLVEIADEAFTIEERRYDTTARRFIRDEITRFDRSP